MRRLNVAAIVLAMGIAGCADAVPYRTSLDELPLPLTWELVNERTETARGFCFNCPSVARYYVASGELPDLLHDAERAVRAAGYPDVFVSDDKCDRNSNGALCSITARNAGILLLVALYPPGDDVDHLGVSRSDKATIRLIAQSS
jgi:hypothetical protein